ncbi:MAG: endonuclease III [Bacteroidia bacterium]|nr:endonuclease III [Bacteroidia bacterium]
MRKKEKTLKILEILGNEIPEPVTELDYKNPFQLLIAVILSAQCTDKRVNLVTPELFKHFPDAKSLSEAEFDDIFPLIRSISYPNNKARHLMGMARLLMEKHEGKVPPSYSDLVELPGVGRKTANVVTSVLYNEPRMPVDTHVFRVTQRLGIAKGTTPLQIENQLVALIPDAMIPKAHHYFILHGRYVCLARSPKCTECPLTELCNYYKKNHKKLTGGSPT